MPMGWSGVTPWIIETFRQGFSLLPGSRFSPKSMRARFIVAQDKLAPHVRGAVLEPGCTQDLPMLFSLGRKACYRF